MIRTSRLALLASCSLALVACASVRGLTPHFGHRAPAPDAQADVSAPSTPPKPHHGRKHTALAQAETAGPPPAADVWPQAYADLPPDPAMRFGVLPNGLRYV